MKVMKKIILHNREFEVFISSKQIGSRMRELAAQLQHDLQNKDVLFVGILNGAFVFAADLLRHVHMNCKVSFLKVASYKGTATTGQVEELIGLCEDLQGKCVVVIEDIIDSGLSMDKVMQMLRERKPAEVKIVTLLFKEESFRGTTRPDYVGFSIPNRFVVGYGLDFDGLGRNYDDIFIMK